MPVWFWIIQSTEKLLRINLFEPLVTALVSVSNVSSSQLGRQPIFFDKLAGAVVFSYLLIASLFEGSILAQRICRVAVFHGVWELGYKVWVPAGLLFPQQSLFD